MPWPVASPPEPGFFTNSLRRSRKEGVVSIGDQYPGGEVMDVLSEKSEGCCLRGAGGFAMGFVAAGRWARAGDGRARGSMLAPVVDVTQRILDERLVLVVPPLAIHDELVLVVPWRQVAHHREHAALLGAGSCLSAPSPAS